MDISFKDVERALKNEEFFLEYQPIMDLDSNVCVGTEALIRWRLQSEVILPDLFIPLIEKTPLSGPLTYWVIETVAKELGDWVRKTERVSLNINVPPEILGRGGLYYAASKCGLLDVADKIVLEITERGVPDELGLQALNMSKEYGMKTCLDDVGANSENLFLLTRTSVDIVKLDKSVAEKMLEPGWTTDVIEGLAAFTRTTSIEVIAEGVETEKQRNLFAEAGVRMAQGYHFSPSLSAEKFIEYFDANSGQVD